MNFADRIAEIAHTKRSLLVLGIDPHLHVLGKPGIPNDYSLSRFCCEVLEACVNSVVAVKFQIAFFEARGIAGMQALRDTIALARSLRLPTIADGKRTDIGSTSEAYAEAYLGDGDFGCDALTVVPYLGFDALQPFFDRIPQGRGIFVVVKTSNPDSGEFQDLPTPQQPLWEVIAQKVADKGARFIGACGLSPLGAVVAATFPKHARRARELMPNSLLLVPGYGAQGAGAGDALAARRHGDAPGVLVNVSRAIMYAYLDSPGSSVQAAAASAAERIRQELNGKLAQAAAMG